MPLYDCTVEHVAETLLQGKSRGIKCCLLVGAGCSRSAGIPLAGEFVERVKERYPHAVKKADAKTYAQCMAALSAGERYELIREPIKGAKVNPAHLAIAQLVEAEFVDRVLTTNFDPLVVKACALIHTPIATYDFAAAQTFNPGDVQPASVFHLHGQHTGFRLLNTEEECNSLREAITPLFEDSAKRRIWIVIGYSGDQDPVFEQLARMERFDHRLYWVVYKDAEPSSHVRTRLLLPEKYAFYVQGHDADGFFTKLAEALDCYPPKFMSQPFTHLQKLFATIQPHSESSSDVERLTALHMISKAKEEYETSENQEIFRLQSRLILGDEDKLVEQLEAKRKSGKLTKEEKDVLAWAYVHQGVFTIEEKESEEAFNSAMEKYRMALEFQPKMQEAFYNWGNALSGLARIREGDDRKRLYRQACKKYEQAAHLKPDDHEALINWGIALAGMARTSTGKTRARLFRDACTKYEQATRIKADDHEVFGNWGASLISLSLCIDGNKQAVAMQKAGELLKRGEEIEPGSCAYNLACLTARQENNDDCRKWIETCRDLGTLPSADHLKKDEDLKNIRRRKWFRDLIKELEGEEAAIAQTGG